jgi:hypothetical protein
LSINDKSKQAYLRIFQIINLIWQTQFEVIIMKNKNYSKNKVLRSAISLTLLMIGSVSFSHANAEKINFKVSGQVNRAITFADNGTDSDILFVDGNNSGTRLRITGQMKLSPNSSAGVIWETQYQDNSSSAIDIGDSDNKSTISSRKRDLWFKGGWGKLSLGQGDGAANGTSEVDYSGTAYIADYSGNNLDDGISFADSTGNKVIKNGKVFSNFDGLSRNDRVRYDTPKLGSLGLAVSGGQDKSEIGLRFSKNLSGGTKLGAALGYIREDKKDFNQLGLSAAFITSGGLNIMGHYGERDIDGNNVKPTGSYVKVGQKLGRHALSLSYHQVEDLAAVGDTAKRTNLAYVYNLRPSIEVYSSLQNSSLARATGPELEDVNQLSVGSRFRF